VADTVDVEKIAHELAGLGEGLKEAREVYQNLQRAIDTKRAELTDVHNLEVEVNSLVAVVETKDALVRERTEQAKTILEEASVRAQEIEGEAQKRADELRGKAVAAWDEEKQRRKRDIDVWG
jgi:cell division septum initiation protein DivIVA